jgi:hypothetical protein
MPASNVVGNRAPQRGGMIIGHLPQPKAAIHGSRPCVQADLVRLARAAALTIARAGPGGWGVKLGVVSNIYLIILTPVSRLFGRLPCCRGVGNGYVCVANSHS